MTSTLSKTCLAFLALFPAAAVAGEPSGPPPMAPEVKKTVDAFVGRWTFDASITVGQAAPVKAKLINDCRRTALGRAIACTLKGKTPMGPMEASFLIGYDELQKAVHLMSMTSDGEVHDHVCRWKDASSLPCDRLKAGMGAVPVTEDLSFRFESANRMRFDSVVTTEDGMRIGFAGTATRK